MSTSRFQRLRAVELADWLQAHPGALILDAREERHHAQGHLAGSLRLDGRNHERLLMREARSRPVFIYCYHGNASQTYADMFVDFGFEQVADLVGGWDAWQKSGPAPHPASSAQAKDEQLVPRFLQDWLKGHGFQDAHTSGQHGNTPLMEAAWRGETAIVQALLERGVDLLAVNGDGNNALWLACVSNDPALVIMLAQAGVPIDHVNATGATSLMYAASSSKPDIVRVLLALGADPLIQTQDDFSALDMAANLACLQLLRAATRAATKAVA
ncbi:ankyrin repeat domain-containing protein [Aquabacterium sp.]|uniref:ankyrin repeat domain-containing protein n=1 Tax=Aquabacterium sp. TaxID=1872578 RepID=UPI0040378833